MFILDDWITHLVSFRGAEAAHHRRLQHVPNSISKSGIFSPDTFFSYPLPAFVLPRCVKCWTPRAWAASLPPWWQSTTRAWTRWSTPTSSASSSTTSRRCWSTTTPTSSTTQTLTLSPSAPLGSWSRSQAHPSFSRYEEDRLDTEIQRTTSFSRISSGVANSQDWSAVSALLERQKKKLFLKNLNNLFIAPQRSDVTFLTWKQETNRN